MSIVCTGSLSVCVSLLSSVSDGRQTVAACKPSLTCVTFWCRIPVVILLSEWQLVLSDISRTHTRTHTHTHTHTHIHSSKCVLCVYEDEQPSRVTELLHNNTEDSSGVAVDYRQDGDLFSIRRLHATSTLCGEQVPVLQYADDCALVTLTLEDLQTVIEHSGMGLTVTTTQLKVACQWSTGVWPTLLAFFCWWWTAAIFQISGEHSLWGQWHWQRQSRERSTKTRNHKGHCIPSSLCHHPPLIQWLWIFGNLQPGLGGLL